MFNFIDLCWVLFGVKEVININRFCQHQIKCYAFLICSSCSHLIQKLSNVKEKKIALIKNN